MCVIPSVYGGGVRDEDRGGVGLVWSRTATMLASESAFLLMAKAILPDQVHCVPFFQQEFFLSRFLKAHTKRLWQASPTCPPKCPDLHQWVL